MDELYRMYIYLNQVSVRSRPVFRSLFYWKAETTTMCGMMGRVCGADVTTRPAVNQWRVSGWWCGSRSWVNCHPPHHPTRHSSSSSSSKHCPALLLQSCIYRPALTRICASSDILIEANSTATTAKRTLEKDNDSIQVGDEIHFGCKHSTNRILTIYYYC